MDDQIIKDINAEIDNAFTPEGAAEIGMLTIKTANNILNRHKDELSTVQPDTGENGQLDIEQQDITDAKLTQRARAEGACSLCRAARKKRPTGLNFAEGGNHQKSHSPI